MFATLPLPELHLALGPLQDRARPLAVRQLTPKVDLELEDGPFDVEIDYYFSPGSPGVHTLPNGDPGYPPDPDDIDIRSVRCGHALLFTAGDGVAVTLPAGFELAELLTDSALSTLEDRLCALAHEQLHSAKQEAAIARFEERLLDQHYGA